MAVSTTTLGIATDRRSRATGAAAALKWGSGVKPKRRKIDEPQPRRRDVVTRRVRLSERYLWLEAPKHDFWGRGVTVMSYHTTVRRFQRSGATSSVVVVLLVAVGGWCGRCVRLSGRGGSGGTYFGDGVGLRSSGKQRHDHVHAAMHCRIMKRREALLRCEARRRRRMGGAPSPPQQQQQQQQQQEQEQEQEEEEEEECVRRTRGPRERGRE